MTRPTNDIQTNADREAARTVHFRAMMREVKRRPPKYISYPKDGWTLYVGDSVVWLWRYHPEIWDFKAVPAIVLQINKKRQAQIWAELASGPVILWVDVERLRPVKKSRSSA